MARNLYEMGDRSPDQTADWLHEQQEQRARIVPVGLVLLALALAGVGMAIFRTVAPAPAAAPPLDSPTVIVESFAVCDSPSDRPCVLSPASYAYRGRIYHLSDIAVPSLTAPHCPAEADRARAARIALARLMNGGSFNAHPDATDPDRSARILSRDGVSLGGLMILKGHARPWSAKPIDWCAA